MGGIYAAPKRWEQKAYPKFDLLQPAPERRTLRVLGTTVLIGSKRGRWKIIEALHTPLWLA